MTEKDQRQLGSTLWSIAELTITQTEKIESLKVYKKVLAQQLFPAINEVGV